MRLPTLLTLATIAFISISHSLASDPTPSAGSAPTPRRDEIVSVVDRVKGAVVNIHSERNVSAEFTDPLRTAVQPQRVNGMGTGIVLDPRGYIITNHHVVDDVQSLRVRLVDGTTCPARVLAMDKESDLAIIKIDPPKLLPTVPLGTATDLMLAEQVIAIGNAFGYEHTVTIGHVSAMKRDVTLNKEVSYKSLIQTQTPINPGNSGGPLFNKLGEVVGVNVAIRAGAQNIAFAIPVDAMIVRAAEMLSARRRAGTRHGIIAHDEVDRPAEDKAARRWVTVSRVDAASPAATAGLQSGDIIDKVADVPVSTTIDLERAMLDRPARATIPVQIRRNGSAAPTVVQLALDPMAIPVQTPADLVWKRVGVQVAPVGADVVARVDRQLRGGLLLQDVAGGSPAAKAGIQKGDVLIGLHLWESINLDNIVFVLNHKDLSNFAPVKAYYLRDGKIQETVIVGLE